MPIPVSLVAEGLLDEQVLRHLLAQSGRDFALGVCYGKRGRDHLAQNIGRFNLAAVHHPFIVLADLENDECPPSLIRQWLPRGCHSNLVLRIAVRKVESWMLADGQAFAEFLVLQRRFALLRRFKGYTHWQPLTKGDCHEHQSFAFQTPPSCSATSQWAATLAQVAAGGH